MLALEEKGLAGYGNRLVSFEKREHKSEELLKWNPRGQVPTFIHQNRAINESMAVCEYLETVYAGQGTKLLPSDHAQLGLVLQRKHEAKNFEQKGADCLLYAFYKDPEEIDVAVLKTKLQAFYIELAIWEKYMSKAEGGDAASVQYLAGGQLSLADITFFPPLALYVRLGLQLDPKYPAMSRYYKRMLTLPSVQKTWPPHWRDTPAKQNIFIDV